MSSVKAVGNSIGLALTAVMEVVVIIERGGRAGTRHCVGRERERQDKDKRQGIRKRGFLTVDSEEHLNRHNVERRFIPSGATAASARSTAPPCGRRPVPFARNLTFGSIAKFRSPGGGDRGKIISSTFIYLFFDLHFMFIIYFISLYIPSIFFFTIIIYNGLNSIGLNT